MWIKICGITREADARAAAEAGADAVGFVFWNRSPRCVSAARARVIASGLPRGVERAGVFVDACRDEILRVAEAADLNWVQLHGTEEREFAVSLGVPWVKAIQVREGGATIPPEDLRDFIRGAFERRYLLDACVEGLPGGTGVSFDRSLAMPVVRAAEAVSGRLILAGGLTAENVGVAIEELRPAGVDVSSGVESSPGMKDASRIRAFVGAVRAASPSGVNPVGRGEGS